MGFTLPSESPVLAPYAEDYDQSPETLSLIREDVRAFQPTGIEPKDDPHMRVAIAKTYYAFKLQQRVKLIHLNDVFKQDLPIWSSSPGLPWSQQGCKNKAAIRDDSDAINRVPWLWQMIKMGLPVDRTDCCAFMRTQLDERNKFKARIVWDYPATMVFGEAVFALPLIRAYAKCETPLVCSYETGGTRKLLCRMEGLNYLSIDYKPFDKSVPEWLIRKAFKILRKYFFEKRFCSGEKETVKNH